LSLPKVCSFDFLHESLDFLLQVRAELVSALMTIVATEEIVSQMEQAQAPLSASPLRDLRTSSTAQLQALSLGLGAVLKCLLCLRRDCVLHTAEGRCKLFCISILSVAASMPDRDH